MHIWPIGTRSKQWCCWWFFFWGFIIRIDVLELLNAFWHYFWNLFAKWFWYCALCLACCVRCSQFASCSRLGTPEFLHYYFVLLLLLEWMMEMKRKESIRKICILKLKPNAKCQMLTYYYTNNEYIFVVIPFRSAPKQNPKMQTKNQPNYNQFSLSLLLYWLTFCA